MLYVSKYARQRYLCAGLEGAELESVMKMMTGMDENNNAVLPLRRDNERYAVAVTPSATINAACLIDDEQAEACHWHFLVVYRVVSLTLLYVCLTWSAMVVVWLPAFLAASIADISHHAHPRKVDDNRRQEPLSRPSNRRATKRAVSEDGKRTPQIGWEKMGRESVELLHRDPQYGQCIHNGPSQTK